MLTCFFLKTLHVVQLIVGLNEGIIKHADKKGCLPLHHAAQTCPETKMLEHLMSVHPQGLTTRTSEGCSPLHLLTMHDFRPGSMKFLFDIEHMHCMNCLTKNGSKLFHVCKNFVITKMPNVFRSSYRLLLKHGLF